MFKPEQKDRLVTESSLVLAREKTTAIADFLGQYGELAGWEEWLEFLRERPELEGFDWARTLAAAFSS